jgi:hypothetical protein
MSSPAAIRYSADEPEPPVKEPDFAGRKRWRKPPFPWKDVLISVVLMALGLWLYLFALAHS